MRNNVPDTWRRQSEHVTPVSSHCTKCGETFIHERSVCPRCGSESLMTAPASTTGTIETWTDISDPPEEFQKNRPYIIGLIRLDDGARVSAQIVDVERSALASGLRVEAVTRKVYVQGPSGLIEYGTKYRPCIKDSKKQEIK